MVTSLGTREEKAVVMSDYLKILPKWFLIVVVASAIASLPYWYGQTQRETQVDHRIKTLESQKPDARLDKIDRRLTRVEFQVTQQKEARERFMQIMDSMDDSLGQLSEAVVELRVEIKNLKQKE